MNTSDLLRYRSRGRPWTLADWIGFACAIVVILAIRRLAEKYFPDISEKALNVISTIIIIVAVLIVNVIEK